MRAVRTLSDGAALARFRVQRASVLWCGFLLSVRQLARLFAGLLAKGGGSEAVQATPTGALH